MQVAFKFNDLRIFRVVAFPIGFICWSIFEDPSSWSRFSLSDCTRTLSPRAQTTARDLIVTRAEWIGTELLWLSRDGCQHSVDSLGDMRGQWNGMGVLKLWVRSDEAMLSWENQGIESPLNFAAFTGVIFPPLFHTCIKIERAHSSWR
jgi:hypothetical protein